MPTTPRPDQDHSAHVTRLVDALKKRGFSILENGGLTNEGAPGVRGTFIARKSYETAVGARDASVCIFPSTPDLVTPSYESEGQNILRAYQFFLDMDPEAELDACEQAVNDSYARRLFRIHGVGANRSELPREEPDAGTAIQH